MSEPSVRRLTQAAGAAYVAVQTAEVAQIERELPQPPAGPPRALLSVDGAMVSLVGGEWAEVKTLVLGAIQPPVVEQGEPVVHSTDLSYFSRLAEAEVFGRLALVEVQRRGGEGATTVAAVLDGAEWEQKFVDLHAPQAVRILDFVHALDRVKEVAQALWPQDAPQREAWVEGHAHCLKQAGPAGCWPNWRLCRPSSPRWRC